MELVVDIRDPFLVIGTGRCGTSTTAKILHTRIGICMGYSFLPPDSTNPEGYYEDRDFVSLNYQLCQQGLDIQDWFRSVAELIAKRQAAQRIWGIKSIRMADVFGLYLSLLNKPRIIWCKRSREGTIGSFIKRYSYSQKQADNIYGFRKQAIERLLQGRDYLALDFTERRDEAEIEQIIRDKYGIR